MTASTTTDQAAPHALSLVRQADGNWSLMPSDSLLDQLPPMAFPASLSAIDATEYAAGILAASGIAAPVLTWHVYGHTLTGAPALRATWSA